MEAVGAGASILTFLMAESAEWIDRVTEKATVIDGPEVIRFLTDEIAQLESVLQRLKQLSFASIDEIDRSQLEGLAKKCKDDLAELDSRLKSLDVSISDGRRGRLWRKLKLCFSEKDLDHIRHVVQDHVRHLTIRLHLIQAQQVSFTATQSTQILSDLQQLKQEIAALRTASAATLVTEGKSPPTSARVTEMDDEEMDCSPDAPLDENISRLMRLLEKKPCVVESDDSEELLKDIEHLLECIRNDAEPVESEGTCQNCCQDVSKELALMSNIILSSPSMMINQTGATRLWRPADEQLLISQERKRKTIETSDGVMTVTAAKRRRKLPSKIEREQGKGENRRDFLAKLTYTSKSTKKMLVLSVNQGQLLFNSFTSMSPCALVCNILPRNSLVFDTARSGSVQDLLKLFEGGEANIHDHDTYGWSLLHHSVGNLPVLKFLIEQGLDIDEAASEPDHSSQITPSHLALKYGVPACHYEALLYAGADMTLDVRGDVAAIQWISFDDTEIGRTRMDQVFRISPFIYSDPSDTQFQDFIPDICRSTCMLVDSEPSEARHKIQMALERGYDINTTLDGQTCLHYLMAKRYTLWLNHIPSYLDLLVFVIQNGADVYAVDVGGYQAAHYAYNATCEACSLFCPSAKGDLWDAALAQLGYDIGEARRRHPRKALYTAGYFREDFERLWRGREGNCPYWDDQPWPSSEQNDTPLSPLTRGQLCEGCEYCATELDCHNCGVCLSSFDFFCDDENHQHDRFCPREQVAVWELQKGDGEFYWELLPFSDSESDYDVTSSEDSDDGGIQLQDGLEEAFSNASVEEVS
ncbi:hypothetical protein RAB80_006484 [Fusarium oxysporum f. sp. vasinfectum]|nr:hypothetical protein RAB80_006484 [Fusarium oxysporum f. sp. vasinfectum]KAK2938832.1 hypothetical protein FoTM2_002050 [Fusarium oxysporum f. sp. vasinfectum]